MNPWVCRVLHQWRAEVNGKKKSSKSKTLSPPAPRPMLTTSCWRGAQRRRPEGDDQKEWPRTRRRPLTLGTYWKRDRGETGLLNDTNRDGLILEPKAPIYVFARRCQNWMITTIMMVTNSLSFFFDQPFPLAVLGSLSTWASSKFSSQNLKLTTCVHASVQVPGSKNELVKKKNTETLSQISSLYPVFNPQQFITVIRIYISVEGTCPQNTGISPLLV